MRNAAIQPRIDIKHGIRQMQSITFDGATYDMNEILNIQLVWNDENDPGRWQLEVTFSSGVVYFEMTKENVASFNAWAAHGRTFVPKSARQLKGPK